MTQVPATALIVSHNSGRVIASCVQAAARMGLEVLVIDNASRDDTVPVIERLGFPLIRNPVNRGFAAAVNQGVLASSEPFLLLLNPDAILLTGVDSLIAACQRPNVAAAGGKLVDSGGVPQKGFNVRRLPTPAALSLELLGINRLWPSNPVNWRYRCLDLDLTKPSTIEQPAGAFLLFRRDAWAQIGGLDEGFYPIWFEDVDFCKRIRDAGKQVFYIPDASAAHTGAHSIEQLGAADRMSYWYRSLLRYSIKHFDVIGRISVCLAVIVGAPIRLLFRSSGQRRAGMLRLHLAVVKLAFRSIWMRKVQLGEPVS